MGDEGPSFPSREAARREWLALRATDPGVPPALLSAAKQFLAGHQLTPGADGLARQLLFLSFCFVTARRNERLERKYRPLLAEEGLRPDHPALRLFFQQYFSPGAARRMRHGREGEERAVGAVVVGPAGAGKQTYVVATAASLGLGVERVDLSRQSISAFIRSHCESVQNWDVKLSLARPEGRAKRVKAHTALHLAAHARPPRKLFLFSNFDYFHTAVMKADHALGVAELRRLTVFARRSRFPFVLTLHPQFEELFDSSAYTRIDLCAVREPALKTLCALICFMETRCRHFERRGTVRERLALFFAAATAAFSAGGAPGLPRQLREAPWQDRPNLAALFNAAELSLLCGEEELPAEATPALPSLEVLEQLLSLRRCQPAPGPALQKRVALEHQEELDVQRVDRLLLGFLRKLHDKDRPMRGRRNVIRTLLSAAQISCQIVDSSIFNLSAESLQA